MSGIYTKINGKFVLSQGNIKYNNQWKDTYQIYTNRNNQWKEVYQYKYNISDWSSCSEPCGGGIQTRVATCTRSDGIVKNDNYCKKYGLQKPILSQVCNTQSCMSGIRFNANTDCGLAIRPIQVDYTGNNYYSPLAKHPKAKYEYAIGQTRAKGGNFAVSDFFDTSVPPPWGFFIDFNSRCGGSNWVTASISSGNATMYTLLTLINNGVPPLDYPGAWTTAAPGCWHQAGCRVVPYRGNPYQCGTLVGDTGDCGDILICIVPK